MDRVEARRRLQPGFRRRRRQRETLPGRLQGPFLGPGASPEIKRRDLRKGFGQARSPSPPSGEVPPPAKRFRARPPPLPARRGGASAREAGSGRGEFQVPYRKPSPSGSNSSSSAIRRAKHKKPVWATI